MPGIRIHGSSQSVPVMYLHREKGLGSLWHPVWMHGPPQALIARSKPRSETFCPEAGCSLTTGAVIYKSNVFTASTINLWGSLKKCVKSGLFSHFPRKKSAFKTEKSQSSVHYTTKIWTKQLISTWHDDIQFAIPFEFEELQSQSFVFNCFILDQWIENKQVKFQSGETA